MSLRVLHLLGSPVLRRESAPVTEITDDVQQLVADLFDTMRAEQGVGLAANQVGVAERVAVVDVGGDPLVLINPEVLEHEGSQTEEEGCLSIPEIFGDVTRAQRVVVATTQPDGSRLEVEATDLKARAILHEIDHLDGVLFLDHLSPLKRRMLLARWQKLRKGSAGYLKEVEPTAGT